MANVNITINGKALSVPAGTTILKAARENGIHIPTLCFLEGLEPHASCRMCVVQVNGARTFQHACAAKVKEGMVVYTDSEPVRQSRKLTLQLLLSNHNVDCHHCLRMGNSRCDDLDPSFCESCFFCDCVKDGFCELQALAREYKVDVLPFTQKHNERCADDSSVIIRNPNKCVKCKRCVDVCGEVQTVHNLCAAGRGSGVMIGPAFGKSMAESECIGCGRCVEVCPTGAIFAQEHKDELVYYAHREGIATVAQVSAALIPELERLLKVEPGTVTMEEIAGGLKKIGIDHVLCASAATERAKREAEALLDKNLGKAPLILSNNYAAQKFLTRNFPELQEHFLFYPTELQAFAALAAEKYPGAKRFAFGPVGSDAAEAAETGRADIAVNARELYRIMQRTGAEPNPKRVAELEEKADRSESKYGRLLERLLWNMEREPERLTVTVSGKQLRCALCHNPGQARKALTELERYDVIRVIA